MGGFGEFAEALQLGFMQRAVAAGVVAGIVCPLLGTFLVLRRLSLIADGLAHVAFVGIAVGVIAHVHTLLTALAVTLLGALGIDRLRAGTWVQGDVAIAMYASIGMGGGIILLNLTAINVDLSSFLFGSLGTVGPSDLALIVSLALLVVVAMYFLYTALLSTTIDETAARAAGVPVALVNFFFIVMTALTVVIALRVVGLLLVTALSVLPVAAALQVAKGVGRTVVISVVFGLISVLVGLVLAYGFDLPTGGTIVLVCTVLFAGTALWRRLRAAAPRSSA